LHPATLPAALLVALVALLNGCTPVAPTLVRLDDAQNSRGSEAAVLEVDRTHPLLLRGVDGIPLAAIRIPNAVRSWSYALAPGPHELWFSSVPYGHPLVPQSVRCYVVEATFEPRGRYVVGVDPTLHIPLIVRADSKEAVAKGTLVDEPLVFERSCRWPARR
jgi:hypothetical protein